MVEKHFYFAGWQYSEGFSSIFFMNYGVGESYSFTYINKNEIIIKGFRNRSTTCVVKNISFVRID